jgi:hypothetical protein
MRPHYLPRARRGIVATWGSTRAERERRYPCDRYLPEADAAYFRAVTVNAPPRVMYRWLCQLRVAPYAFDWLDNGGRQSPRRLIPGVEALAPGQQVMRVFELAEFVPDQQITVQMVSRGAIALFGQVALSYVVTPSSSSQSRLVAKLLVRYPRRGLPALMRWLLPLGDLIMMRKQLLTLKALAESTGGETWVASLDVV